MTFSASTAIAPPSGWLAAAEPMRAAAELALFACTAPPLLALSARGDGHPVLVLPGLLGGDRSTAPLRAVLRHLGFDARAWELGRNFGARSIGPDGARLSAVVEGLFEETGRRISLVGWSLGGILARLMAKRLPAAIRQVVTLGSPFAGGPKATNAWRVYEAASGEKVNDRASRAMLDELRAPLAMPSTAIFSRSDGVCAWQACCDTPGAQRENIEVLGSHCGLGANPMVAYAVADRLAQPEDKWERFRPRGFAALVFPGRGELA